MCSRVLLWCSLVWLVFSQCLCCCFVCVLFCSKECLFWFCFGWQRVPFGLWVSSVCLVLDRDSDSGLSGFSSWCVVFASVFFVCLSVSDAFASGGFVCWFVCDLVVYQLCALECLFCCLLCSRVGILALRSAEFRFWKVCHGSAVSTLA